WSEAPRGAVVGRHSGLLGEDLADQRHNLGAVELDRAQAGARGCGTVRVLERETAHAHRADRRGDLARDRLGRTDVEGTVGDLGVELLAAHGRPAALGTDLVAILLERPEGDLAGFLVRLGDEAGGVDADRAGGGPELLGGTVVEVDVLREAAGRAAVARGPEPG